jgi:ABC-type antimicrobial peptide transport system ATPase subunit
MTGKSNLPRWESTTDKLNELLLLKMARLPQRAVIGQEIHMLFRFAKSLLTLPGAKIVVQYAKASIFIIVHHFNAVWKLLFQQQTSSYVDGVSRSS